MEDPNIYSRITFPDDRTKNEREYWLKKLSGKIEKSYFPYDFQITGSGNNKKGNVEKISFNISGELFFRLIRICNDSDPRLHMVLAATLIALLYKYTGNTDIIIGAPIPRLDIDADFVNTVLILRNLLHDEATYKELLLQVRKGVVEAMENVNYSIESILYQLDIPHSEGDFPLFDVTILLENIHDKRYIQHIPHNVTFSFLKNESQLEGEVEYTFSLYRQSTIKRIVAHFLYLLKEAVFNVDEKLVHLSIIPPEEKRQLLSDFNGIATDAYRHQTVHGLFADQLSKTPDHVALIFGERFMTYDELEKESNRLANYLFIEKSIRPGRIVGIFLDASDKQVTAILGVLKSGGAYVPISVSFPEERVKSIVGDAEIGVIISQKRYVRILNRLQWSCQTLQTYICLDSHDIKAEDETEKSELMNNKLWDFISQSGKDKITGGGWKSSYTGEPLSEDEMEEYGCNVLSKLKPLFHEKMRVLEIGCASGISMFKIAPHVEHYLGTDLSSEMIDSNRQRIKNENRTNILLKCLAAHEIDTLEESGFDLVVMNSVIQCFHGHNYLGKVIQKSIDRLGDRGYLFIGDVMDLDLKDELIESLKKFKKEEKDKNFPTKTDLSAELFVSRDYFNDLDVEQPCISNIEFSKKIHSIENELTRFRYDVLITIDKSRINKKKKGGKRKFQEDLSILGKFNIDKSMASVKPDNGAYLVYTSGTTGIPKAAVAEHRGVVNTLAFRKEEYRLNNRNTALQLFSYAFDGFVTSMFTPLISGTRTVFQQELGDVFEIKKNIMRHQVTHFICVPALYRALIDNADNCDLASLEVVALAGERVSPGLVEISRMRNGNIELVNEYGVTEASVMSTVFRHLEQAMDLSIGKPIWNTRIYILNKSNQVQPIGVAGELCIAGLGLAREYFKRPQLTTEKFIPDPYVEGDRIYRTGDMARWLIDGNLEFLGRLDHQIKIRGYRIEPGEIENQLLRNEAIRDAFVMEQTDEGGDKYLCAHVVLEENQDIMGIKEELSKFLPEYMIPSHFFTVDVIPRTPGGKVAIGKLQNLNQRRAEDYVAPRNHVERVLVSLCSEILGVGEEEIGIDSSFFDLGGHSLRATILTSKIHKTLNVKVPLSEVFKLQTVRLLAEYIQNLTKDIYESIRPVEKRQYYPLSSAQKRLYILYHLDPASTNYNVPFVIKLDEAFDLKRVEETFRKMVSRHESLRTSFGMRDGEPFQKVHERPDLKIDYYDARSKLEEMRGSDIQAVIDDFIKPFDLVQAPLLRVGFIKISETRNVLLLDMHHIITDGTSRAIMKEEFLKLYEEEELSPLRLQYKDFSRWQNSSEQQQLIKRQAEYWGKVFSGDLPVLNLPTDYERPAIQSFEGASMDFVLDSRHAGALKEMARKTSATLYMIVCAVLNVLLSRLGGQEDIIIGTPIAARRHSDLQGIIGMFVNTLAMRNHPAEEKQFKDFLHEVKQTTLEAYENQEYQFEDLVDTRVTTRDTSRNPLFDVMFNLLNETDYTREISEFKGDDHYLYQHKTSKFDLNLMAVERSGMILFDLEYCTRLFKPETIERFINYLKIIMAAVAENPDLKIGAVPLLSGEEKAVIIKQSEGIRESINPGQTVHLWFETAVKKLPAGVALVLDDRQMTYRVLNEKSNQLGGLLRDKGVGAGTIVGLLEERSLEMVIGILGIMKAGGAYLPIDTRYPEERRRYMLSDSGAEILVTSFRPEKLAGTIPGNIDIIDPGKASVSAGNGNNLIHINTGSDILYLLYTSGSTGRPKGVMLEHQNLVSLLKYMRKYTNINYASVLQFTSIGFDVSFQEIFFTLINGGVLYLIYDERDLIRLFEVIEKNAIKTLFLPASFLKFVFGEPEYLDSFPIGVEHLVTAGEQVVINDNLRDYLRDNKVFLHNHYGPTETHVVTFFTIDPTGEIPRLPSIGKPIMNIEIYILSRSRNLMPNGVAGEVYIGGIQMGRGYLGRIELTGDRFCTHPFREGERLYRSGDLARWTPDGLIEFLGRIDDQIKIRGFRIEPGEIECQLLSHSEIKEAAVLVHGIEQKERFLCAYIVSDSDLSEFELKSYLSQKLPDYMIPSYFMKIDHIPLTVNRKVDRRALPTPEPELERDCIAPRNRVERELVEAWSEVLRIDASLIGIDEGFFSLGGNSLKATILIAKVHKQLGARVPLAQIFKNPTIRVLSDYIKKAEPASFTAIPPTEKKEYYALSSAQMRLYFMQQVDQESVAYNMPGIYLFREEVDKNKLQKIFRRLVERHESLRTSFVAIHGDPVQRIHDNMELDIDFKEIQKNNSGEILNHFVKPFDLARAPLIRMGLFDIKETGNLLLFDLHHILTDGISNRILYENFMSLYHGEELPPLKLQYKDYTEWRRLESESGVIKEQEEYWLKELGGGTAELNIPTDYSRPDVMTFEGDVLFFEIDRELTGKIKEKVGRLRVSLMMFLLTVHKISLSKYSGQEEIILGTTSTGRSHHDLQDIMGFFVNLLPIKTRADKNKTFLEYLMEVKDKCINAFENQDYPFLELVSKLGLERHPGRHPLFDTTFEFHEGEDIETSGFDEAELRKDLNLNVSHFDFILCAREAAGLISMFFEYSTSLFRRTTMQKYKDTYMEILRQVVDQENIKLGEIEVTFKSLSSKSNIIQDDQDDWDLR